MRRFCPARDASPAGEQLSRADESKLAGRVPARERRLIVSNGLNWHGRARCRWASWQITAAFAV